MLRVWSTDSSSTASGYSGSCWAGFDFQLSKAQVAEYAFNGDGNDDEEKEEREAVMVVGLGFFVPVVVVAKN